MTSRRRQYIRVILLILQLGDRWEWVGPWLLCPIVYVLRKGPVPVRADEEKRRSRALIWFRTSRDPALIDSKQEVHSSDYLSR